jgi:hypothetical protein
MYIVKGGGSETLGNMHISDTKGCSDMIQTLMHTYSMDSPEYDYDCEIIAF